jgi:hypothetical protein
MREMINQSSSSSSSSEANDFVVDQLTVLLRQEVAYRCPDYMSRDFQRRHVAQKMQAPLQFVEECAAVCTDPYLHKALSTTSFQPSPTDVRRITTVEAQQQQAAVAAESPPVPNSSADMDHLPPWRSQMCAWAYTAGDTFGHHRSTVAVAFNLLDRYLAAESIAGATITREDFQLYTMTCLYMAVKLMEECHEQISLYSMVDMSRGYFSTSDFEQTELEILAALDWRVNPPTAATICNLLLELFGRDDDVELRNSSLRYCEQAVIDPYFVSQSASDIAMSAILLSARRRAYHESTLVDFCCTVAGHIDHTSPRFVAVYQHMLLH